MAGRYQLKRSALVVGGIAAYGIASISRYVDENFGRIPVHLPPILKTPVPARDVANTTSSAATSNTTLIATAIQTVAALASGAVLSHNATDAPAHQSHATTKFDSDSDSMKFCVLVLTVVFTLWQAYAQRQRGKLYVCVTIALSLLQSVDLVYQTMFALFCCSMLLQQVAPASLDVAGHRKRIFAIAAEIMCRTVESTLGVEKPSPTLSSYKSHVHDIVPVRPELAALPDFNAISQMRVVFDEAPRVDQKHRDERTVRLSTTHIALRWLKIMWRRRNTAANEQAALVLQLGAKLAHEGDAHQLERKQQDDILDGVKDELKRISDSNDQFQKEIASANATIQILNEKIEEHEQAAQNHEEARMQLFERLWRSEEEEEKAKKNLDAAMSKQSDQATQIDRLERTVQEKEQDRQNLTQALTRAKSDLEAAQKELSAAKSTNQGWMADTHSLPQAQEESRSACGVRTAEQLCATPINEILGSAQDTSTAELDRLTQANAKLQSAQSTSSAEIDRLTQANAKLKSAQESLKAQHKAKLKSAQESLEAQHKKELQSAQESLEACHKEEVERIDGIFKKHYKSEAEGWVRGQIAKFNDPMGEHQQQLRMKWDEDERESRKRQRDAQEKLFDKRVQNVRKEADAQVAKERMLSKGAKDNLLPLKISNMKLEADVVKLRQLNASLHALLPTPRPASDPTRNTPSASGVFAPRSVVDDVIEIVGTLVNEAVHYADAASIPQTAASRQPAISSPAADTSASAHAGDRADSSNAGDKTSDPAGLPSSGGSPAAMPVVADGQPSTAQPTTAIGKASESVPWSVDFTAETSLSNAFAAGGSNTQTPQAARGQARRPPRIGRPHPPRRRKGQHEE